MAQAQHPKKCPRPPDLYLLLLNKQAPAVCGNIYRGFLYLNTCKRPNVFPITQQTKNLLLITRVLSRMNKKVIIVVCALMLLALTWIELGVGVFSTPWAGT